MVPVPPMIADRQKHRTAGTAGTHASPKTRRTRGSAPARSSAAAGYSTVVTRFTARAAASANRSVSAWRLDRAGNSTRPAIVTTCRGRKASIAAQFKSPTAATPLHAVTKAGTTASPAMLIRMLPWNSIPNFSTGASSRHPRPARDERRRRRDRRTQEQRKPEGRREGRAEARGWIEVPPLDQRRPEPQLAESDAEGDHEGDDGVEAEHLGRQQASQNDAAAGRDNDAHDLLGAEKPEASKRSAPEPRRARPGHRPPCSRTYAATTRRHEPCARSSSSTHSRSAPCPPLARVTTCATAFTGVAASATAIASPAVCIAGMSRRSSPM